MNMDMSNYNCDCPPPPNNYDSNGFGGGYPGLFVPGGANILSFTSTDFSALISASMGREIGFSAFEQMGSTMAAGAEAMIILAMNQCNAVLSQNEALIAGPSSTSTSTTTKTVYHESGAGLPPGAPKGATDAYIYNYKGADGNEHQSIVYVDKNGKEIEKQDFVLNTVSSAILEDANGNPIANGTAKDGEEVKIGNTTYTLVDTKTKDAEGHEIFALKDKDGKIEGTITFDGISGADGTIKVCTSALLDYDSANDATTGSGVLKDSSNNTVTSGADPVVGDTITIDGKTYTLESKNDDGTFELKADDGTTLSNVTINKPDSSGNAKYSIPNAPPEGFVDGYALSQQGCDSDGHKVKTKDVDANSCAPGTDSTTTTPVTQNTADPLTTMSAVFKYAEVYAEAMTMMSTYEQTNIDDFKNRPH